MKVIRAIAGIIIAAATAAVLAATLARDEPGASTASFGLSDCEFIHDGAVAQPANTWTALALVATAIWVAATTDRRDMGRDLVLAAAITFAGLSSFVAHATTSGIGGRLDAAAAAMVLITVAAAAVRSWPAVAWSAAASSLAAVAWWAPGALEAVGLVTAGLAAAAIGFTHRPTGRSGTKALATAVSGIAGLITWWLGRSGAPLCDPDGPLQAHGAWHVLAAATLVLLVHYLRSSDPSQHDAPSTLP